jgi:hypothetical protein
MMRELTGKVIDLLEDSSLEAIKVSSNRQPSLFRERWLGMQLSCGFAPAACRSGAPFCHPVSKSSSRHYFGQMYSSLVILCLRSEYSDFVRRIGALHSSLWGHSTVADINASNVCCA